VRPVFEPGRGSVVKLSAITGLAKFANLMDELKAAEAKEFGSKVPPGVERERNLLIKAIAGDRTSGFYLGQLAAEYRDHYKKEQTWMRIGESIAHALGYKSYTSLNTLMTAAERASKIPDILLAALIEEGIDPAENKYRRLVNGLASTKFAGTAKDAHAVVVSALATIRSRKKQSADRKRENKIASAKQIGARIAKQVTLRLRDTVPDKKRNELEAIVRRLADAVRAELPDCVIRLTWGSDSVDASADSRLKSVRVRGTGAADRVPPPNNPSGKTVPRIGAENASLPPTNKDANSGTEGVSPLGPSSLRMRSIDEENPHPRPKRHRPGPARESSQPAAVNQLSLW
jgi:hypothetical protein